MQTIDCANCGTRFSYGRSRGRPPIYCSRECGAAGRRRYEHERRRRPLRTFICDNCGEPFQQHIGAPAKYCATCHPRKKRDPKPYRGPITRTCDNCGAEYTRAGNIGRFCTPDCRHKWQYAHYIPPYSKVCPVCGVQFRGDKDAKTCSRTCANVWSQAARLAALEAARREKYDNGWLPLPKNHHARAIRFGCEYDKAVTRDAVLERDDWTCHLCGKSIDPTIPWPIPEGRWHDYGTIDHVIPMSKGGPHTWENVRAAHAGCNNAKAADCL